MDVDLFLGNGQARLIPSDLEIGIGRIGAHTDARAQPLRLGGLRLGASRLRGTAQSAEEIDFPTGLRTDVIEPLIPTVSRDTLRGFPDRAIHGRKRRLRLAMESA